MHCPSRMYAVATALIIGHVGSFGARVGAVGVTAQFETPVVAYVAPTTHAWFSQIFNPGTGPLVLVASLGGDGTAAKCPGTCAGTPGPSGKCPDVNGSVHCSLALISKDFGKSWDSLESWVICPDNTNTLSTLDLSRIPSPTRPLPTHSLTLALLTRFDCPPLNLTAGRRE
jgi:hypothetical protein